MPSAQDANPTSLVPFEHDTTPTTLPPPYTGPTPAEEDVNAGDEEYNPQPPTSIQINASTSIRGSNNFVMSTPYDAVHITTTIMTALQKQNPQVATANFHVRIDRSVNIVGDRNLLGPFGLRPRQPVAANATTAPRVTAAVARKRKPEEQCDGTPEAKKATARATSCPPS